MSHYITTHDDAGKSVFAESSKERKVHTIPGGTMEVLYSTHTVPADVSTRKDIEQYEHDTSNLFPAEPFLSPPNGAAAAIVSFEPDSTSLLHRTMTFDGIVILEGTVELSLDSGEKRIMRAGDSVMQRATMHQWRNLSPESRRAKMICFAVPIQQPFVVAGKTLTTDMGYGST